MSRLGAIWVLAVLALSFTACGGGTGRGSGSDECETAADCTEGWQCFEAACHAPCTEAANCAPGTVCATVTNAAEETFQLCVDAALFPCTGDTVDTACLPLAVGVCEHRACSEAGVCQVVADADCPTLTVTRLTPATGPASGGTLVVIEAQGLDSAAEVTLGGAPLTGLRTVAEGRFTALTPAGQAGPAELVAVNPNGLTARLPAAFTYVADASLPGAPPALTGLRPTTGPAAGGTLVAGAGANIDAAAQLFLGGTPVAEWHLVDAGTFTFVTPPGVAGTPVDIAITNPDGRTATLASAFTYHAEAGEPPLIERVVPVAGPVAGGTAVTVFGARFDPELVFFLDGRPLAADALGDVTATTIALVTPAHPAGAVAFAVTNPDGRSAALAGAFTYGPVGPRLDAVVPNSGPPSGGADLTITGAGFVDGVALYFGADPAIDLALVDPNTLTATSPPGTEGQAFDLRVVNPDGLADVLPAGFAIRAVEEPPPPAVTGVVPPQGPVAGGNTALIVGSGFVEGATVRFGDTAAPAVEVIGPRAVQVTVPAGAEGAVDVTVTNPDTRSATLAAAYTYVAPDVVVPPTPPVIQAIWPERGPIGGGTRVIVSGRNFLEGIRAELGGAAVAELHWLDNLTLTLVTPPGTAGPADLTLTNVDGGTVTFAGAFTYYDPATAGPAPAMANVRPDEGPVAGNTAVLTSGANFVEGAQMFVCNRPAADVAVHSATELSFSTPAGTPGLCDIAITNPDGQSAVLVDAFAYYIPSGSTPSPVITGLVPSAGDVAGGAAVELRGTGFAADALLFFAGRPMADAEYVDPTTLRFVTPPHAAGSVPAQVTNPDGQSYRLAAAFTYFVAPPFLGYIDPVSGPTYGGFMVQAHGEHFSADMTVLLGDEPVDAVFIDAQTFEFEAPARPAGRYDLTVIAAGGLSSTLTAALTYYEPGTEPAPVVSGLSPASGSVAGGYLVIVSGENFLPGATVRFGSTDSPAATVQTAEVITAEVPPGPAGAVAVTVRNPDGQEGQLAAAFTYLLASDALRLERVSPNAGPASGGTLLTLTGDGFEAGATVIVGTAFADDVAVAGSQTILATAPAGEVGPADVQVALEGGRTATIENAFFYYDPASPAPFPEIAAIHPLVGPTSGGTVLSIRGSNFDGNATVYVGRAPTPVAARYGSTHLVVLTPAAAAGPVDITVVNGDGKSATLEAGFTYYDPTGPVAPLTLLNIAPAVGPTTGGTAVTVTGQGFLPGLTLLVGALPASDVQLDGTGSLQAVVPPGTLGTADVTVVNADGRSATLTAAFTYVLAAPAITQIVPTRGPIAGGTEVVLVGSGFAEGAHVLFGDSPASDVVFFNSDALRATTPAGAPGVVAVRVLNPDGQSATLAAAFEYVEQPFGDPPPTLTSLTPNVGPVAGGSVVLVAGSGFTTGATVLFGGATARRVQIVDPNRLVVVTPAAQAAGTVDVSVLNADGQGATLTGGYHYVTPSSAAPRLSGITPSRGPALGGTSLILTGSGFQQGGLAYIGYRPVPNLVRLNQSIATALSPAGDPGAADVVWTNPDGQVALIPGGFSYAAAPRVDAVDPAVGPVGGGTIVTVAGDHFADGARVRIGGADATSVVFLSAQVLSCRTPAGSEGAADLTVINPDGQSNTLPGGFTYLLPPQLFAAEPAYVLASGGTPVLLYGRHLAPGLALQVGETLIDDYTYLTSEALQFSAPPGVPDDLPAIRATNPDGQAAVLYNALLYVDPDLLEDPPPQLAEVFPGRGPTTGGTEGYVTGTDFQTGAFLLFGGRPLAADAVVHAALARFTTAPVAAPGLVSVTLVNPDGQFASLDEAFEYLDPETLGPGPEVTAVDPESGPTAGGDDLRISGNFLDDAAIAMLGDRPLADVGLVDMNVLGGTTPEGEAGLATLIVTNPDGQSTVVEDAFLYVPPPVIDSITPATGPSVGHTPAVIRGANFVMGSTPATKSRVFFCDSYEPMDNCEQAPASTTVVQSATQIDLVTPAHTPGLADVVVVNPDGQYVILVDGFSFTPPPAITNVTPNHGSTTGGESITIAGQGFGAGAVVTLGDDLCLDIVVWDSTRIVCTTPRVLTAGPVGVTVLNPNGATATLGGGFLYISPPDVTRVYPTNGPETGGTTVTIEGADFAVGPPQKATVFFGLTEVDEDDVTVVSPTLIRVVSPPGIGLVAVTVQNPDGQRDVVAGAFTYTPPIPAPIVTYVAPDYGSIDGGVLVNVVGQNFLAGATVFFGREPSWTEGFDAEVRNNGTLILVTTPAHSAGVFDVKVRNTDQQEVILEDAFEFIEPLELPALAFTGIAPNRGAVEGGYIAVISGRGFKYGIEVYVGDALTSTWVSVADLLRLGPTALRVVMPEAPNGGGWYDIMLQNPSSGDPDYIIETDAFQYTRGGVFLPKGHRLPIDGRDDNQAVIFDANGDGLNDVLVLRQSDPDEIFINTPQDADAGGWFENQTTTLLVGSPDCTSAYPTVSDFDGDSDLDVVFWCNNNRIYLYRNAGDGTLTAEAVGPSISSVQDVEVGDLNCDGVPDLFISRDNAANVVWIGNGLGSFSEAPAGTFPTVSEPSRGAAIGDVDHDGDPDVLVANDNAYQNRLYYNNCNNIEWPPTCNLNIPNCTMATWNGHRYAFCTTNRAWAAAQADCTAYGFDLATVNSDAERTWMRTQIGAASWLGYSDAALEGTWRWLYDTTSYTSWCSGEPNGSTAANCADMTTNSTGCFADQDCNSTRRYVCEAATPTCPVLWQFVDGEYGEGLNFPVSGGNTRDALLFDVDVDGWLDAILINNGQTNRIYMNDGGSFRNDTGLRYPQSETNLNSYQAHLVDVDRDGDLDLLIRKRVGTSPERFWLELYLNDRNNGGAGTFSSVSLANLPPYFTEDTLYFAFGDLDDDRLPDIYVVNDDRQDRILFNNGYIPNQPRIEGNRVPIGAFADGTIVGYPPDNDDTRSVDIGDLDNDGDPDLVTCVWNGKVKVLINDGLGNFFDRTNERLLAMTANRACSKVKLADMDADDDLDLLIGVYYNTDSGQLSDGQKRQLVNDGDGYFVADVTSVNMPQANGYNYDIDVGDIDRDGDLDALFTGYRCYYSCTSDAVLMTNGGDPFNVGGAYLFDQTSRWFGGSIQWEVSRAGRLVDLNMDGHLDLYVGRSGAQNMLFHFVPATQRFVDVTTSHLPAISTTTRDVEVWDFDDDGDQDIFVTNNGLNRLNIGENDRRFSDVTSTHIPQLSGDNRASAIGDVDEDGLMDVVVVNWSSEKAFLYLNTGGGHLGDGSANLPWDLDPSNDVVMADFDADGDVDIFIANDGQNRIYLNQNHQPE